MSLFSLHRLWSAGLRPRAGLTPRRRPGRTPLCLEQLETRIVLSTPPYLLKDLNSDTRSSIPSYITAVNGSLFFAADDGIHGTELWKSDGTAAGTALVKDVNPGSAGSWPGWLTVAPHEGCRNVSPMDC
jgi:ELWxxDGT repeat protein